MANAKKIPINNRPAANDLWKGIGGHFDSFDQILCEFVDNSVSNFTANKPVSKTIRLGFKEQAGGSIEVTVEDSGTGIRNLDAAFCLGNRSAAESPLNEHGFGLKHALASANPANDAWQICTRTKEDFEGKVYKSVTSAYEIENFGATLIDAQTTNWPGELNGSGTHIRFSCSRELFQTIRAGVPGNVSGFAALIAILAEDLGFIYAGLIQENRASIAIRAIDKAGSVQVLDIRAIQPEWKDIYDPKPSTVKVDLGHGDVRLKYQFGAIKAGSFYKYYRANMSSSGLEIRINGRVIAFNLFKEVWSKERHNMYNHLLVVVDIIADTRNALPPTRTSKNGLREGDPRLVKLYEWVRNQMPDPTKDTALAYDEGDLFDQLAEAKKTHLPGSKTVSREQNVYGSIKAKIPIDLYVSHAGVVTIYEGKKDNTSVQDVYQLKMYWDGCVLDGINPTEAILIAANHPESVLDLIGYIRNMTDISGRNYNFVLKTWREEGIRYPN